jgi:PhzF family phenazine biosynthesis protein
MWRGKMRDGRGMMKVKVYVVSAFCKDNDGGNKAGVVLFNDSLSDADKRAISSELGYAETVFVNECENADFKIEYFTPAEEVPLCGHATIATFAMMQHLNMLDKREYTFETKAGILNISIDDGRVFMEQNKPEYFEILEKAEIEDCFDIDCILDKCPIQIVSTGLRDIIVPIENEQALNGMEPDFDRITEISRRQDVVGMHAFALEGERIICRNFAPLYDISEESATGTANCALVSYLYRHGIVRKDEYTIEQGQSLNSPSEIIVRIFENGGEIERIFVGGYGNFVEEREIGIN